MRGCGPGQAGSQKRLISDRVRYSPITEAITFPIKATDDSGFRWLFLQPRRPVQNQRDWQGVGGSVLGYGIDQKPAVGRHIVRCIAPGVRFEEGRSDSRFERRRC